MPKFRVLEKSFVDNALRNEGDVIESTPPEGTKVGDNLEPLKGKNVKTDAEAAAEESPELA
jgi:hypothetical protein